MEHVRRVDQADNLAGDGIDFASGDIGRAVEPLEDDDEFVAARARDRVVRAHAGAEAFAGLFQDLIAGIVAISVIEDLEIVQVQKQQRAILLAARGQRQRMREPVLHQAPVRQSRQRIEEGELADRFFGFLQGGHVGGKLAEQALPGGADKGKARTLPVCNAGIRLLEFVDGLGGNAAVEYLGVADAGYDAQVVPCRPGRAPDPLFARHPERRAPSLVHVQVAAIVILDRGDEGTGIHERVEALFAVDQFKLGAAQAGAGAGIVQFALQCGRQARQIVLHDVIIGAGFHDGDRHLLADGAGDQDEGGVAVLQSAQGQCIHAVKAQHGKVRQHHIPLLRQCFGQRSTVLHALRRQVEACLVQRAHDQRGVVIRVLHQQHPERAPHAGTRVGAFWFKVSQ